MSSDLSATNEAAQSVEPVQSLPPVPVEQAWFGLCLVALLMATMPLWIRQEYFPRVPMIRGLDCGEWGESVLNAVMVPLLSALTIGLLPKRLERWLKKWLNSDYGSRELSAASTETSSMEEEIPADLLVSRKYLRGVWIGLLLVFSFWALSDQNKLQPWVWHALLVCAYSIGTCHDRVRWRRGMVVLTAAIYFWSAISKFDDSFATSYGQQLIEAMLGPNRVASFRMLRPEDRVFFARLLPIGELLTAVLLLVPYSRRFGCGLSIVMHLGLMLAVGPFGLNHRAGVFLWNIYFIGQNSLLWRFDKRGARFQRAQTEEESGTFRTRPSMQSFLPAAVLIFAAVFPALRSFRLCDNWPAWAVYASDLEFVTIYVSDAGLDRLPQRVRRFAEPPTVKTGWTPIRIEQWALAECHAPIYPQDRFYVAVALAIAKDAQLGTDELLVVWRSRPRNGQRESITLRGPGEVRRFAQRYWLNLEADEKSR